MKTAVNNEPNQNPGFAKNRTQPEPESKKCARTEPEPDVYRERNEHEPIFKVLRTQTEPLSSKNRTEHEALTRSFSAAKIHQISFGGWAPPSPARGTYSAPQTP